MRCLISYACHMAKWGDRNVIGAGMSGEGAGKIIALLLAAGILPARWQKCLAVTGAFLVLWNELS